MLKYFKSNVIQIPSLFVAAYFTSEYVSFPVLRFFYTISKLFIDSIGLLVPFLVFVYLFSTILNVGQKALVLLVTIFSLVMISNVLTTLTTFGISHLVLPFVPLKIKSILINNSDNLITPFFSFYFSGTTYLGIVMFFAIALALLISLFGSQDLNKKLIQITMGIKDTLTNLFSALISYMLPLYIFGFLLKIFYEGDALYIYNNFLMVLLMYVAFTSTYIVLFYVISCEYASIKFFESIKNIFPASVTGFLTMSSAATLPITVSSVQKTLNDQKTAYLIVPSSANIHLIGDNIFAILTGFTILILNGFSLPSFLEFIPFLFFYSFAILASAGIPGGNVLIMVAVLQDYLHFTSEMSNIFITLYVLQDSFLTAFNILGNGAFAILFKGLLNKFPYLNNN